jgi:hypothetical protein
MSHHLYSEFRQRDHVYRTQDGHISCSSGSMLTDRTAHLNDHVDVDHSQTMISSPDATYMLATPMMQPFQQAASVVTPSLQSSTSLLNFGRAHEQTYSPTHLSMGTATPYKSFSDDVMIKGNEDDFKKYTKSKKTTSTGKDTSVECQVVYTDEAFMKENPLGILYAQHEEPLSCKSASPSLGQYLGIGSLGALLRGKGKSPAKKVAEENKHPEEKHGLSATTNAAAAAAAATVMAATITPRKQMMEQSGQASSYEWHTRMRDGVSGTDTQKSVTISALPFATPRQRPTQYQPTPMPIYERKIPSMSFFGPAFCKLQLFV